MEAYANMNQDVEEQSKVISIDGDLQLSQGEYIITDRGMQITSAGFGYILEEARRRIPAFHLVEHGYTLSQALIYCRDNNPSNSFC